MNTLNLMTFDSYTVLTLEPFPNVLFPLQEQ